MGDYGYFSGTVYNGNGEWTITQLTIRIAPKGTDKSAKQELGPREYNVDINVPPLTNADLLVKAESGGLSNFDWRIQNARGYKSK